MQIKAIEGTKIKDALELAWDVFQEFEAPDYSAEGVAEFKQFLDDENEIHKLDLFGAFEDSRLAGMLAMRGTHVSLFFVQKEYHRRGIGKSLFQYMLKQKKFSEMTVNSSPYALEVYRRLGFTATEGERTTNGIRYIPMKYQTK